MVLAALTGYGRVDDKQHAAAIGFDHHLTKPAAPDAIEQLLASVSHKAGQIQEDLRASLEFLKLALDPHAPRAMA